MARSNEEINDIIRSAVIEKLREGSPRWQEIANGLKDKGIKNINGTNISGRQIRESWVNYLNPSLNFESLRRWLKIRMVKRER